MRREEILRVVIAIVAIICMLTVMLLSISGIENGFSDNMLTIMKIVGGVGIAALLIQTGLAFVRLSKFEKKQK